MVLAAERVAATLARERPEHLARALDTGVLLANVAGLLDRISQDAGNHSGVAMYAAQCGVRSDTRLMLSTCLADVRRALDLAESTLRFLEGDTA